MSEELKLTTTIQGIIKFKNHIQMMKRLNKKKRDMLIRISEKNIKLVVYDNEFSEICYLGILHKKFFLEYKFKGEVTLKINNTKKLYNMMNHNSRFAETMDIFFLDQSQFEGQEVDVEYKFENETVKLRCKCRYERDDREFGDIDKTIEKKKKNKIQLITSHINSLEILEIYKHNNMYVKFTRDYIEINGENDYTMPVTKINMRAFKSYDFQSFKYVMVDHNTLCFNSPVISSFVKSCSRVGILVVYIYINKTTSDNQLKFYLIGEGQYETLFSSFNTDLVDRFDDNISGLTPYSKFRVPLSTNMSSIGALKSVKIEAGMSVKMEEMSQTCSTVKREDRPRKSSKDPFRKIKTKKKKGKKGQFKKYENRTTLLGKRSPSIKMEAMSTISAPKVKKVKKEYSKLLKGDN